jgi:4a-hydroxytetrahydrobiopterin dehydratase
MSTLSSKHCTPCEGGAPAMAKAEGEELVKQLDRWDLDAHGREIRKTFGFDDFHQTMAFVNAVAWIAHKENHHPDLQVGYNRVGVRYRTHAIDGLSENDFICAAKIDRIMRLD